MTLQIIKQYEAIESQRQVLKEQRFYLIQTGADDKLINEIFEQITNLTFKEAHILKGLERKA